MWQSGPLAGAHGGMEGNSRAVGSRARPPGCLAGEDAGRELRLALAGRKVGDTVHFRLPLIAGPWKFCQATVLRDFRTASGAKLLRLAPSGTLWICKCGDLTREHALMCAVRQMNRRWQQHSLRSCGHIVEAVTYDIIPLGLEAGLVEVVLSSRSLYDLAQDWSRSERHIRVAQELGDEPARLDRLAATTAGYLTMCYSLGVRDGHDENLMLRQDGSLFRVDFGFAFGEAPEIDAPQVFVPQAVSYALGALRWAEVVRVCSDALQVLSGEGVRTLSLTGLLFAPAGQQPPAWDLLRAVPELGPLLGQAHRYVQTLSLEAFEREVSRADEWSLARAAKNTVRQAARFIALTREGDTTPWKAYSPAAFLASFDPFGFACQLSAGQKALHITHIGNIDPSTEPL